MANALLEKRRKLQRFRADIGIAGEPCEHPGDVLGGRLAEQGKGDSRESAAFLFGNTRPHRMRRNGHPQRGKPQGIVEMLNACESASEGRAFGPGCRSGKARLPPQRHPSPAVPVDPIGLDFRLVEEFLQGNIAAQVSQSRREALERRTDRARDAFQNDVPRDAIELHGTAAREKREVLLDLPGDACPRAAQESTISGVEAEAPVGPPDEVEDRKAVLAVRAPEAAAELLEKDRRTFGWPQEETVSISGTSMPSLKRSTANRMLTSRALRRCNAVRRSSSGEFAETAIA